MTSPLFYALPAAAMSLTLNGYRRYGRQMILDGLGLPGQLKLQSASAVVIGAGGLGCPALQYLCAGGVGRLGIVDADTVDLSNLQRQILHTEASIGSPKCESAAAALRKLNSETIIEVHNERLDSSNASRILSSFDIILDCTDNLPTRYLLSDYAVTLNKPLVSGAAQRFDGQLTVYNLPLRDGFGPCYRCMFPKPAPVETVGTCEETGIFGPVTGIIGTMQALEAMKVLAGLADGVPSMLLYSTLAFPPFRTIKLRSRRPNCPACDPNRDESLLQTDYIAFCGTINSAIGDSIELPRLTAHELQIQLSDPRGKVKLIDVRPSTEFGICSLPSSINVPLPRLLEDPKSHLSPGSNGTTVLLCRQGNDSQIAARALIAAAKEDANLEENQVFDLIGGLRSWSTDVDTNFPIY